MDVWMLAFDEDAVGRWCLGLESW